MSSDAHHRAPKQPRTEDATVAPPEVRKHSHLWFDDGNIILVANDDGLGFRLHRSILSFHSGVFRDILALPSSAEDNELMDGCPVLRLQDCGDDLELFFFLLHDGIHPLLFNESNEPSFPAVRAMVILGFKYDVESIKAMGIRWLKCYFPPDFRSYLAVAAHRRAHLQDCVAVVNLARKFNLPDFLRVALYECTTLEPAQLLEPVDYGPSGTETLSPDDLRLCLNAASRLERLNLDKVHSIYRHTCRRPECMIALALDNLKERFPYVFSWRWTFRPIDGEVWLAIAISPATQPIIRNVCDDCRSSIFKIHGNHRKEMWQKLLHVYNLEPEPQDAAP